MSEIKQMYLNAYYGKSFKEEPLPDAGESADDEHNFKQAYRREKSGVIGTAKED